MRSVNAALFEKLKKRSTNFVTCWLVTRQDGQQFGFTSHDMQFEFEGVVYYPENGIASEATQEKNDFSTNNATSRVVFGANINEHDVRIGLFDYSDVKCFWVDPYNPEQGSIPILRGYMGELTLQNNEFQAELRSLLDLLQLPFGHQYNLECDARLGDRRCGVNMNPDAWTPNTAYVANISGDARIGAVVKPSTENGLWYRCTAGTHNTDVYFPRGTSYQGLGPDPFVGTGINPFNGLGPMWGLLFAQLYQAAISQPSTVPGNPNYVTVTLHGGNTGATEPVWPTVVGGTVTDGELTWTAFPARIQNGVVTGVISRTQFQDSTRTEGTGTYQYGVLEWLTGENAGRQTEVRGQVFGHPTTFTLLEVMPCPIRKDDTYRVTQGCSKNRVVCQARFDNVLNHRGFPDMPTEDRALTSPNFSSSQDLSFDDGGGGGGKK